MCYMGNDDLPLSVYQLLASSNKGETADFDGVLPDEFIRWKNPDSEENKGEDKK